MFRLHLRRIRHQADLLFKRSCKMEVDHPTKEAEKSELKLTQNRFSSLFDDIPKSGEQPSNSELPEVFDLADENVTVSKEASEDSTEAEKILESNENGASISRVL